MVTPISLLQITWDCTNSSNWPFVANWHILDAEYNNSLKPFTSVEYLLEIRLKHLEKLLAVYTAEKKKYEDEDNYLDWKRGWPWRYFITEQEEARLRSGEPWRLKGCAESDVMRISKTLENDYEGKRDSREIALLCTEFVTLDTPDKLIACKMKKYQEVEVNPLLAQIEQVQERLKTDLAKLDEQTALEKPAFDRFKKAYFECLIGLSVTPLCEQKPLTTTEVASVLEHLPRRMALIRTGGIPEQAENEPNVHLVRTLDTPTHVSPEEFARRMTDIQDRTRKKYCRARLEVEQELRSHAETEDKDLAEETTHDKATPPPDDLDLLRFDDE